MKRSQTSSDNNPVKTTDSKSEKYDKLSQVFMKALDSSLDSIRKEDINECFGDIAEKYGNNIESALMNEFEKSRTSLEENFRKFCQNKNLYNKLNELDDIDKIKSTVTKSFPQIDNYSNIINTENDQLKASINKLKSHIFEMKHNLDHLKNQAVEQVAALEEEVKKVAIAAEAVQIL